MRRLGTILIASSLLFATGCWDRVEIENRGFVVGVALDKPDKSKYKATLQIVIPAGMKDSKGGGGGASGAEGKQTEPTAYTNVTAEGATIVEAIRRVGTKTSRTPYMQQLQMIVLSQSMAEELPKLIDFFIRSQEIRQSIKVIVAKGEAKSILNISPKTDKLPVLYLRSELNNYLMTSKMLNVDYYRLGEIREELLAGNSIALPFAEKIGNDVKIDKAAVYNGKTHRFAGLLQEKDIEILNLMKGKYRNGLVDISMEGGHVIYEVNKTSRTIHIDEAGEGHMKFTIFVQTNGSIREADGMFDFSDKKTIDDAKRGAERELAKIIKQTVNKVQHVLRSDVIGFNKELKRKRYRLWKRIRSDWDGGKNEFAKSEIKVKVHAEIMGSGSLTETAKGEGEP